MRSRSYGRIIFFLSSSLIFFPGICYSATPQSADADKNQNVEIIAEDIELILQTKVSNIILGDEFGIQRNNITYIGMLNLFELLDFAISVDVNNKKASGWFIREDNSFSIAPINNTSNALEIISKNNHFQISNQQYIHQTDDIYIDAKVLFKSLEIDFEINLSNLTLLIKSKSPLPVQEKLARSKKEKANIRNENSILPRKKIPYTALGIPFIDANTRYLSNSTGHSALSYSALASGDLAYMTGTYYLQGDRENHLKNLRITLTRDSIENNLLGPLKATHISIGEITPNSNGGIGSAGQEVGARISNKPFGHQLRQQTDFVGDIQPGWDVELYRNNLFLGSQTVGENGRYEFFDQDLVPGKNEFKLIFYGPQGQRREKLKHINLNKEGTYIGKTLYDVSISKQRSKLFELNDNISKETEENRRFNVNLFQDINQKLSLQGTFSRYTFFDGTRHNFIKSAFKLNLFDILFFANVTKDISNGYSQFYNIASTVWEQSLSFGYTRRTADFKTESSNFDLVEEQSHSAAISGPFVRSTYLNANYALDASRTVKKNTSATNSAGVQGSANLFRLKGNSSLNYIDNNTYGSSRTRSITGITNIGTSISRLGVRGSAAYSLKPIKKIRLEKLSKLSASLSWQFTSKLRSQYSYSYSPIKKNATQGLSAHWITTLFSIVSNYTKSPNGDYSMYIGINFSLGYDPKTSKIKIGHERIANTGAVSAQIYIDDNNNGTHESSEPLLEDAKIKAEQAYKSGKTDSDGIVFIPGLPTNRVTDVTIDVESLKDPFLVPSTSEYSFLPRPGLVEHLNIPLVTSGEIEGTIYLENKGGSTQTRGYVPMILTNIKTLKKHKEFSAFDGFYLFSSVPPGEYLLSIDKPYLKKNSYKIRKPITRVITILPSGNVDAGNDFQVYISTD